MRNRSKMFRFFLVSFFPSLSISFFFLSFLSLSLSPSLSLPLSLSLSLSLSLPILSPPHPTFLRSNILVTSVRPRRIVLFGKLFCQAYLTQIVMKVLITGESVVMVCTALITAWRDFSSIEMHNFILSRISRWILVFLTWDVDCFQHAYTMR